MRIRDVLMISGANVLRDGKKSFLAAAAVGIGIFSVSLISGIGQTVSNLVEQKVMETGLGGIAVYTEQKSLSQVNENIIAEIEDKTEGLKGITPFIIENGSAVIRGKSKNTAFIGVNSSIQDVFHINVLHGDLLSSNDISAKARVAIVDERFAQENYERSNILGKKLIFRINGIREEFTVKAVIASQKQGIESMIGMSLPTMIYIPYTTVNEITEKTTSDKMMISCMAGADETDVAESAAKKLESINGAVYKYENIDSYVSGLWDMVEAVKIFISVVAGVSLLVGGIGIMNCMTYTVDFRKNDIGIYMALGEKRSGILLRFLTESVLLCTAGGAGGIIMLFVVTVLAESFAGISLNIGIDIIAGNISMAFLCGIVFGIIPAYKASRLEPIEIIVR